MQDKGEAPRLLKHELKFDGYGQTAHSKSQALQDVFVLAALNGKRRGSFLEIGASDGKMLSNTYLLEKRFGWRGISVDLSWGSRLSHLRHLRKSKFALGDATAMDYGALLGKLSPNSVIDYLSLDIEPMTNTLLALERLPLDQFTFRTVTYETDWYDNTFSRAEANEVRDKSRQIFSSRGYVLVASDVHLGDASRPFEDWWVHPTHVAPERLAALRNAFEPNQSPTQLLFGNSERLTLGPGGDEQEIKD